MPSGGPCYGDDDCESYVCGTDHLCNGIGSTCIGRNNCFSGYCDSNNHVCTDGSIGQGCGYYLDCSSGYCDTYNHTCTDGSVGQGCGESYDCVYNYCDNEGFCWSGTQQGAGGTCYGNSDCTSGNCSGNRCVGNNGDTCYFGTDCASGFCDSVDRCSNQNVALGDYCNANDDCGQGFCSNNSGRCSLLGQGDTCSSNADCDTNFCDSGWNCSSPSQTNGSYCYFGDDCASGNCSGNRCMGNDGDSCGSSGDCASGFCDSAFICSEQNVTPVGSCYANDDCISGSCTGNICDSYQIGNSCDGNGQCISNNCSNNVCSILQAGDYCDINGSLDCASGFCDSSNHCWDSNVSPGGLCYASDDCISGLCENSYCSLIATGYPCDNNGSSDCASGHCNDENYCSNSGLGIGDTCYGSDDCQSTYCLGNVCVKLPNDEPCDGNGGQDCESGNCDSAGYCSSLDVLYLGTCHVDDDCRSGFCDSNACSNYLDGTACNSKGDYSCESSHCNSNTICSTANQVSGNPCWADDDCINGSCINSSCSYIANGNTCDGNGGQDCVDGFCDTYNNVCTRGSVGQGCANDAECSDGASCGPDHLCGGAGAVCGDSSQCNSGFCNNNLQTCTDGTGYCTSGGDCSSGYCDTLDSVCTTGDVGQSCGSPSDCSGGQCGTDNKCNGIGSMCVKSGHEEITINNSGYSMHDFCTSWGACAPCASGYCDSNNTICTNGNVGDGCGDNADCASTNCVNYICAPSSNPLSDLGGSCTQSSDCSAGACGSDSLCGGTGATCSTDGECDADNQCIGNVCTSFFSASFPVSNITVNSAGNATTVINNNTLQISATVLPSTAVQAVTWSVINETGTATINSSGLLTAISAGTVTVEASATDTSNVVGTKQITIIPENIAVTSVSLNSHSNTLTVGDTHQLSQTISPTNATNKSVAWSSSNSNIATVDNNGLVTAISAGSATVTVTTEDGNYTDANSITVNDALVINNGGGGGGNYYVSPISIINNKKTDDLLYVPNQPTVVTITQSTVDSISQTLNQIKQSLLSLLLEQPTTPPPAPKNSSTSEVKTNTVKITEDRNTSVEIYQRILKAVRSLLNIIYNIDNK